VVACEFREAAWRLAGQIGDHGGYRQRFSARSLVSTDGKGARRYLS
jgi:hypothetical protein